MIPTGGTVGQGEGIIDDINVLFFFIPDLPKEITDSITIYIHDRDNVPRMSIATIAELCAKLDVLDQLPKWDRTKLLEGVFAPPNVQLIAEVRNKLADIPEPPFPFLGHVTDDIYFMSKRDDFFSGIKWVEINTNLAIPRPTRPI